MPDYFQPIGQQAKHAATVLLTVRYSTGVSQPSTVQGVRNIKSKQNLPSINTHKSKQFPRPDHNINPLFFGIFSAEIWTAVCNWVTSLFSKVMINYKYLSVKLIKYLFRSRIKLVMYD